MKRARVRELALPVLLIAAILAAAIGAALALHRIEVRHQRDVIASRQARAKTIVDAAFRAPLQRLAQVAAGIEAGSPGTPASFRILTRQMMATPEVGAVGYVERVTERDRARWERANGLEMKATATPGSPPAPARPVHYVVRSVVARAPVPPGTDLAADPTRVATMRRAAGLGEAAFTPPVTRFGRDSAKPLQLVAFQPVHAGPVGSRFISATFTFDALATSLARTLPAGTTVAIDDEGATLARVGDGGGRTQTRRLRLAGRDLRVRTRIAYADGTPWDELVLLVGLLVAAGVGAFAVASRRRERAFDAKAGERLAERKAVEADLDRERGFSATLISALPDGLVASDNRGVIVINDAMCELTGYPRRELMGRLFPHGFWPEDSLLEVQRLRDRVTETGAGQMELTLRTKSDERIPVLVSASRVEGRHGPIEISLVSDNRERAEATRRLTESEAKLRSLANAATDMVVALSRAERIEWASPSAELVLGYTPEELVGRRFGDLFECGGLGRLDAEGRVYRSRHKDGHVIWAETTVTPTLDAAGDVGGMRASIRDVTEREAARAELQREQTRYRRMVELLPDTIVFMVDRERRFTLAGGGGLHVTGWDPEDIEGRTLDEVLVTPEQQVPLPYWEAALDGRSDEVSYTAVSGREYLARFMTLTDEDGAPDGAMAVATDITRLRDLQAPEVRSPHPGAV